MVKDDKVTSKPEDFSEGASESDSDEAPEDVPFSVTKDAALKEEQATKEAERQAAEKLREKRKKAHELFLEQKQTKNDTLASKRLPEELLDELPAAPRTQTQPPVKKSKIPVPQSKPSKHIKKFDSSDDFIPLSKDSNASTEFKLAVLEKKSWTPGSLKASKQVQDFRRSVLFDSRVRREPVSAMRQGQQKQQAAGKSSFVK